MREAGTFQQRARAFVMTYKGLELDSVIMHKIYDNGREFMEITMVADGFNLEKPGTNTLPEEVMKDLQDSLIESCKKFIDHHFQNNADYTGLKFGLRHEISEPK